MQESLFDDDEPAMPGTLRPAALRDRRLQQGDGHDAVEADATAGATKPRRGKPDAVVRPAAPDAQLLALANELPGGVHLGTSSWFFPGWAGLVWDGVYPQAQLSRHGLAAYARHPLLRTVSVDRSFYRPLTALQYAAYAQQVPDDFRFVVKAPGLVSDVLVRDEEGRGMRTNPAFLDTPLASREFVEPALEGLGTKLGALVFQLSPLPAGLLAQAPELLHRLRTMLSALPALQPRAPDGVIAVEVRNPELLAPAFADVLRDCGATYCLGLHAKMPPIEAQLPMLRALWPSPLVCRWSLNRRHGAYGYEEAKTLYEPFDRIVDADLPTREVLARVIAGTVGAGRNAYVTANNKAEGSAPLTVLALAEEVRRLRRAGG
ncbi:MAG: DUF72 domain-containing protein [Comamonadaceae bacterium]|nr:MAG: DUF72 domain-containing protein [Comamonadaceae bacterium]